MKPSEIVIDPEFQKLIPPLTAEELSQLEENLLASGCREPLSTWYERPVCPCGGTQLSQGGGVFQCDVCGKNLTVQPVLLDGHNRLAICRKHDLDFTTTVVPSVEGRGEAKAWIIKNQMGRRNIKESQRAMLATTLKELYAEGAKPRQLATLKQNVSTVKSNLTERSKGSAREQAAAAMNVSAGLVHAAEKVQSHGSEKLQQAVMTGEASVSAAAEVATLPKDQQDKVVDAGKKEIVAAAKKVRHARARRSGRGQISPDALTPVRKAVPLPAKTALDLPHDPVWAAKTLISVFDREFLVGLVSEITLFLHGDPR